MNAVGKEIWTPCLSVPKEVTEAMLRFGAGRKESRYRILLCAMAMDREQFAGLLREEYRMTSLGLVLGSDHWSMSCEEDAIYIAEGRSALSKNGRHAAYRYEDAADIIQKLVADGMYAEQQVVNEAKDMVVDEMADNFVLLARTVSDTPSGADDRITEIVHEKFGCDSVKYLLKEYILQNGIGPLLDYVKKLKKQRVSLAGYYYKNLAHVQEMAEVIAEGTCVPDTSPFFYMETPLLFITEDEIKKYFVRKGSCVSCGKYRIYSYLTSGHSKLEEIAFLKKEYGNGGGTPGLCGWDDSYNSYEPGKGVVLRKGDGRKFEVWARKRNGCLPAEDATDRSVELVMPWPECRDRIKALIRDNEYLTEKEVGNIRDYERDRIADGPRYFFHYIDDEDLPEGLRPSKAVKNVTNRDRAIGELIARKYVGDRKKEEELLSFMEALYPSVAERYVDSHRAKYGMEKFRDYLDGKAVLFPEKEKLFAASSSQPSVGAAVAELEDQRQMTIFDFPDFFF